MWNNVNGIAFYNMVVFLVARRIMTYDFYCCIASYVHIILWFGYESNRNSKQYVRYDS
jgi:hypothetical protein